MLDWPQGQAGEEGQEEVATERRPADVVPAQAPEARAGDGLVEPEGPRALPDHRGELMPIFKGNLFIAAEMGRELMRLRFHPDNASKIVSVERMLTDQIGGVRVVSEAPDGSLYVATESVLYRLAP